MCVKASEGGDLELVKEGSTLLSSLRPSSFRKPAVSWRDAPREKGPWPQPHLPDWPWQSLGWWMLQLDCPMPGIKGVHLCCFAPWLSSLQGCPGRSPETPYPAHDQQLGSKRDENQLQLTLKYVFAEKLFLRLHLLSHQHSHFMLLTCSVLKQISV